MLPAPQQTPLVPAPATTAPLAAPPVTPSTTCRNCGAARLGEYCQDCGQHFLEERLHIRSLLQDLVQQHLSVNRGLLRTIIEMTRSPGSVVRRFIQGQRRRYVNPFTYLFFGAAVALLFFVLYRDQYELWMQAKMAGLDENQDVLTTAQAREYGRILFSLSQQAAYTSLAMCVPFALLIRLFARKRGINLAEAFVFSLYGFGHATLLGSLATPLLLLSGISIDVQVNISYAIYMLVFAHLAHGFFGRGVRPILLVIAALVVAYGAFSLLLGGGTMAYVILTK